MTRNKSKEALALVVCVFSLLWTGSVTGTPSYQGQAEQLLDDIEMAVSEYRCVPKDTREAIDMVLKMKHLEPARSDIDDISFNYEGATMTVTVVEDGHGCISKSQEYVATTSLSTEFPMCN